MKRLLTVTLLIALAACERKAGRIGEVPFAVDANAALAQAKAENKPLFVEFWSDDCGACVALEADLTDDPMQRRLKQYVCVRVLVSLGEDGKPKDPAQVALWTTCRAKGVPSVAALRPDGTLIASESGPGAEDLEALLTKGLEPAK